MGIVKHTVILWSLAFSLCGWATAAEGLARTEDTAPAEEQDSGIRLASCLVKVTTDPAVLPLSQEIIDSMFRSPRVFGESARKIFISVPRNDATVLRIRVLSVGAHPVTDQYLLPDNHQIENLSPEGRIRPRSDQSGEAEVQYGARRPAVGDMTTGIRPQRVPSDQPGEAGVQYGARRPAVGDVTTGRRPQMVPYADLSSMQSTLLFKVTIELPEDTKLKPEVAQFDAEVEKYPPDRKPAARLFMKGLIAHFQVLLLNISEEERQRVQGQIHTAAEEVELADRKLAEIQTELRAMSASHNLSQGTIGNEIAAMQAELESFRLKQATDAAFRQTLLGRIDEVRGKVDQSSVKDPIATELEKIVANRTQQLQFSEELVKNNTAPLNAVDAARYDLAKAQIDLLQRREELGRKAGNQELDGLTSKLAELSLQTMQTESRMGGIEEGIRRAQALLPDADAYERKSIRVEVAKRALEAAVVRLDRAEQRLRLMEAPSVTVIGGD